MLVFPNLLNSKIEVSARGLLPQKYAGQVISYVQSCLLCVIGKKNNRITQAVTLPTALLKPRLQNIAQVINIQQLIYSTVIVLLGKI